MAKLLHIILPSTPFIILKLIYHNYLD